MSEFFATDPVRDFENREAQYLDACDQIDYEARFCPPSDERVRDSIRPPIKAGDMIKCPKCGMWHYLNDPCD